MIPLFKLLNKSVFNIKTLSPVGFLFLAGLIAMIFAISHGLGWREHTTVLSGTLTSASGNAEMTIFRGMFYLLSYFGFVLLTPILILAAGIWSLLRLIFLRQNASR